jgi:hypothetical protein
MENRRLSYRALSYGSTGVLVMFYFIYIYIHKYTLYPAVSILCDERMWTNAERTLSVVYNCTAVSVLEYFV